MNWIKWADRAPGSAHRILIKWSDGAYEAVELKGNWPDDSIYYHKDRRGCFVTHWAHIPDAPSDRARQPQCCAHQHLVGELYRTREDLRYWRSKAEVLEIQKIDLEYKNNKSWW